MELQKLTDAEMTACFRQNVMNCFAALHGTGTLPEGKAWHKYVLMGSDFSFDGFRNCIFNELGGQFGDELMARFNKAFFDAFDGMFMNKSKFPSLTFHDFYICP